MFLFLILLLSSLWLCKIQFVFNIAQEVHSFLLFIVADPGVLFQFPEDFSDEVRVSCLWTYCHVEVN